MKTDLPLVIRAFCLLPPYPSIFRTFIFLIFLLLLGIHAVGVKTNKQKKQKTYHLGETFVKNIKGHFSQKYIVVLDCPYD